MCSRSQFERCAFVIVNLVNGKTQFGGAGQTLKSTDRCFSFKHKEGQKPTTTQVVGAGRGLARRLYPMEMWGLQ